MDKYHTTEFLKPDKSKSMNKKLLLEFIPLVLFVLAGICSLFKLPFAGLATFLFGMLVGTLYFPVAFWLFDQYKISIVSKVVAGLTYSEVIIAIMFSIQKFPNGKLFCIISYGLLGLTIIICLFNYRSGLYKPLLYRCFLFVVLLSFVFGYRFLL